MRGQPTDRANPAAPGHASCLTHRAIDAGLMGCHICGLVARARPGHHQRCPRCGAALHYRKPNSLSTTWALLLTAMLMYIPAMGLPVMQTAAFGSTQGDTIMSGVIYFLKHGDWPLALIIFVASVMVPILKMLALVYLLVSVHRHSRMRHRQRTVLYRITELMGRWSMVDVFVIAIMAALVQMGNLARITPGLGAVAFAGVVVLTMLAALAFDPRLIWDHQERLKHHE
ncbi:MAG TPA: paraquat-inducible membrane protein A [Sedimenticola sp.]|nr:paraquat-inducible membrane protein A [Sedimenticola sp.]